MFARDCFLQLCPCGSYKQTIKRNLLIGIQRLPDTSRFLHTQRCALRPLACCSCRLSSLHISSSLQGVGGCCVVQGAGVPAVQVLEVADEVFQDRYNGPGLLGGQLCAHARCGRVAAVPCIVVLPASKAEATCVVDLAIPLQAMLTPVMTLNLLRHHDRHHPSPALTDLACLQGATESGPCTWCPTACCA